MFVCAQAATSWVVARRVLAFSGCVTPRLHARVRARVVEEQSPSWSWVDYIEAAVVGWWTRICLGGRSVGWGNRAVVEVDRTWHACAGRGLCRRAVGRYGVNSRPSIGVCLCERVADERIQVWSIDRSLVRQIEFDTTTTRSMRACVHAKHRDTEK